MPPAHHPAHPASQFPVPQPHPEDDAFPLYASNCSHCAVAEWNSRDILFMTVLYLLPLVDAANAQAAAQAPLPPAHQAHPCTLDTLLRERVEAVPAVQATHGEVQLPQAQAHISALRLPCHRVVQAAPQAEVGLAEDTHQAEPLLPFLFIVPVPLKVPLTNTL